MMMPHTIHLEDGPNCAQARLCKPRADASLQQFIRRHGSNIAGLVMEPQIAL